MIDSTVFGSITIDGRTYHHDVIVSWDGEVEEFEVSVRHVFGTPEFERIMKKEPELIIVGTGDSGLLRVSEEVKRSCEQRRIELIETISREAIQKFNDALRQRKRVVGFIHTTC